MSIDLSAAFNNAEGEKRLQEAFDLKQVEIAVSQGQMDATQSNMRLAFSRVSGGRAQQDAKRKMAESTHTFMVLLDQLQNIIDVAERDLQSRYGEDYLSAMADKYGIDTEGKSPEEIRKAMIEELQKDKYKDDPTAQKDLVKLREIEEAKDLAADIKRDGWTPENEERFNKAGYRQKALIHENGNDIVQQKVEGDLKLNIEGSATSKISSTSDLEFTLGLVTP